MINEGEFFKKKNDNFDKLYKEFHKASFEVHIRYQQFATQDENYKYKNEYD